MFRKLLNLWIFLGFFSTGLVADLLPIPSFEPDLAQVAYLRRSLALLQSSSPSNRPDFRILIYGQSFSAGPWSELLVTELKTMYPNVNFILTNSAIAGLTAWSLSYSANADIGPWQPDLVFFNTLFDEPDSYERLFKTIRQSCIADVVIHADPPRSEIQLNESLDPEVITRESYLVLKNYFWWPEIANRYANCFADIRTPWKQYLIENGLRFDSVLVEDKAHFNENGQKLQSKLLAPFFKPRNFELPFDPWNCDRVVTRQIGSELQWKDGVLELKILGNRVDVEYVSDAPPNSPAYSYTIDGKAPIDAGDLFGFDRASRSYWFGVWPGILYVESAAPLQEESWTLQVLDMNTADGDVTYRITGSKTGFDGIGSSLRPFVSDSKRVVISADMLMAYKDYVATQQRPPAGWEIHFDSVRRSIDTFKPFSSPAPGVPAVQTLFLSSSDSEHTLRIQCASGKPSGIRAIRAYSPSGHAALANTVRVLPNGGEFTIRRSNSSILISWPTTWGVGRVQRRIALAPSGVWTDLDHPFVQVGNRYEISRPLDASGGFFRWNP